MLNQTETELIKNTINATGYPRGPIISHYEPTRMRIAHRLCNQLGFKMYNHPSQLAMWFMYHATAENPYPPNRRRAIAFEILSIADVGMYYTQAGMLHEFKEKWPLSVLEAVARWAQHAREHDRFDLDRAQGGHAIWARYFCPEAQPQIYETIVDIPNE